MPKVLVPLAPGFEEIEALTVVDILRRAGAEVIVAGTVPGPIEGRSRIKVLPETVMENAGADYDVIFLPGGAVGTENLKKNEYVRTAVEDLMKRAKLVTAICAAPTVLSAIGATRGRTVTSHPSVRHELKNEIVSDERVVMDGNIITSQGPGTAMEFAFKLVEALFGKAKAEEVNKGVLAKI
ncbi:MAG: 4-methyl-5(B-hydroxyethyl)-thiazole monophosphate biosynthesis protein [Deltaproteobacteria bacterium GWA2_55_10]|nr:MAG: 4-methyl-5(B-hydroxyethyl)-thiazole monophosphate biosynthesis protein [Deltaproteobacteria bacterium GWA2_55_10]